MQLTRVYPNAVVPGLLAPQVQGVPFKSYIGSFTNYGGMAAEQIYLPTVTNINSETSVGQQWGRQLANQSFTMGQVSAPYYLIEAYFEYNVMEQAKFEALGTGTSLPAFLENLALQGINQRRHEAILFGFDPATTMNQGILANATESNLPADSVGNQTITGYDVAELQAFLSTIIRNVMDSSYGMLRPTTIASSTRVINYLQTAIVPLTESQKDGSGVDTVAGLFGRVTTWLGAGPVIFIKDEKLKDDTNGDKIVFVAPGMDSQDQGDPEGENLVGEQNSVRFNTMVDEAMGVQGWDYPSEGGVLAKKLSYKMTPGITLRNEAVNVVIAKYA